jgi:TorA maturation chaperone TorD
MQVAIDRLAARADLCRLLAACYYEPEPAWAEERVFDAMVEAARRIDPALADPALAESAQRLASVFAEHALQAQLVDYTQLFLGPVQAPARPYGALWLEDSQQLMQVSTQAVQALYEAGGFAVADDFHELPDHIAAELEFCYALLFREAQAERNGAAEDARAARALRLRLLDEHLGRWVPAFAAAVESGARTDFYRALARLTADFVDIELRLTAPPADAARAAPAA